MRAVLAVTAVLLAGPATTTAAAGPGWSPVARLPGLGPLPAQPVLAVAPGGDGIIVAVTPRFGEPGTLKVAVRAPGGAFDAPVALSVPGADALEFAAATARSGAAIVVWDQIDSATGDQTVLLATRRGGGAFSAPVAVGPGQSPRVGMSAAGEAVIAWEATDADGVGGDVVARLAPGAAAPAPPVPLLDTSASAVTGAALAVGADGTAVLAFRGADGTVQASISRAGGTVDAPAGLSRPGVLTGPPTGAVDARGGAMVVWARQEFDTPETGFQPVAVEAAARAPGGGFTPLPDLAPVTAPASDPVVAGDDAGEMTVAWRERSGVLAVTVPPGAGAGPPAMIVADRAPDERLQQPPALAAAPDGTTAIGLDGDRSPRPGVVLVAVRPPGAPSFGPVCTVAADGGRPALAAGSAGEVSAAWTQVSGPDEEVFTSGYALQGRTHCAAPPQIISLKLRPVSFRASRRGPSIGHRGARVTLRLTRAARVTWTVQRVANLEGGWKALPGRFRRRFAAGRSAVRFTGRLRHRSLRPGYYRLVAVPRAAGGSGAAATAEFQIRR